MMPEHFKNNDTELFAQLAADSQPALHAIAMRYEKMLMLRIEQIVHNPEWAREVLSDTIHTLWINRKEVAEKINPVAWLVVTARHKAINMIRNEKRKRTSSIEQFPLIESTYRIEIEIEEKELKKLIDLAAEKLAPREKLVYTLSIKNGLSRKEIAMQLNVSENTVKNQLRNAMIHLRKQLSKLINSILV